MLRIDISLLINITMIDKRNIPVDKTPVNFRYTELLFICLLRGLKINRAHSSNGLADNGLLCISESVCINYAFVITSSKQDNFFFHLNVSNVRTRKSHLTTMPLALVCLVSTTHTVIFASVHEPLY